MVVLAWTVIAAAWFVVVPFFLSLPNFDDEGFKWWEPYAGWAVLNGMVAALGAVAFLIAWAIAWAIGVIGGS